MMDQFQNKKQIFNKIKSDLFPAVTFQKISFKILSLHLVACLFVLSICPQFGFGVFKNGHYGLTTLFMSVSHEFCMFACGVLLTTTSLTLIWSQLKMTEKEWILNHSLTSNSLLLLVTSSFFWMFSPDIILIDFCIWLAGSILIAVTANELLPAEN